MTSTALEGLQSYQCLSHRFVLVCPDPILRRRVTELMRDFTQSRGEVAFGSDDAGSTTYSLLGALTAGGRPWYSLRRDGEEVAVGPEAGAVVDQLLWQISVDTLARPQRCVLVHAGAVVSPAGGGMLILGESGAGKTTLVAALVQDGFGYLSDEAGVLDPDTCLLQPWPRPLGFKHPERPLARFACLFPPPGTAGAHETRHVRAELLRAGAIAAPSPVRHVIDYRYEPGAEPNVLPLSRATTLARIGSAAPGLRDHGQAGLDILGRMVRGASTHELVSGDLERSVALVRELASA